MRQGRKLTRLWDGLVATLVAVFMIGLVPVPTLAATPGSTCDTTAYTYDAPALLSSRSAAASHVRGSPSEPASASWGRSVAVGGCGVAAETGAAVVDAGKSDYFFGKVASNARSPARSAQNAQQLARIGVYDNAAGRLLLSSHFDDVVVSSDNIARTFINEYGTFQVRDSLFAGPGGFLRFESTWQVIDDGLRLTTAIPMGGS